MAAGLLRLQIIGNVGSDVKTSSTKTGVPAANFRVACNSARNKERTEWIGACCFGKTAELAGQYLQKGARVYLDGRFQTREWVAKTGEKKTDVELVVEEMVFLGGGREAGAGPGAGPGASPGGKAALDTPLAEEDIPF